MLQEVLEIAIVPVFLLAALSHISRRINYDFDSGLFLVLVFFANSVFLMILLLIASISTKYAYKTHSFYFYVLVL